MEGHFKLQQRKSQIIPSFMERPAELGILILRMGMGIAYVYHGAPKIFGGPDTWTRVGGAMSNFGIDFLPVFWGLVAAVSEFFGGIFLIAGFMVRPACAMIILTMIVAAASHFSRGQGLSGASHAIENGIVIFGLMIIGPGKYKLANLMKFPRRPA